MSSTTSERPRVVGRRLWMPSIASGREGGLAFAVIAIFILVGISTPGFVDVRSVGSVLNDSVSVGLLAMGLSLVIIAGGIDISVSSIYAASAISAGLVAQASGSAGLAVMAGLACGLTLGAVNAVLIVVIGIEPIVATLATFGIFRGLLVAATNGVQVNRLPSSYTAIADTRLWQVPLPVWIFAVTLIAIVIVTQWTGFGRAVFAIGNNRAAAERSGLNVRGVVFSTYLFSGATAGLAGVVFLARNQTVLATSGVGLELLAIAAVVIGGVSIFGGRGHLLGVGLAAVLLATIDSSIVTIGVPAAWLDAVTGLAIVLAIGLLSLSERIRRPQSE